MSMAEQVSTHPPATMAAAVFDRFGGPDVVSVRQMAVPKVGDKEVLVRVKASTVSAADHRLRARDLPKGMGLLAGPVVGWLRPRRTVLGMDFSGTVARVGPDVTLFRPGDDVVGLTGSAFGGHAQYLTIPETAAICRLPAGVSHQDAVALMFGGHTMSEVMRRRPIRAGESVLVNGASGAVGAAAVQVAKHAGATVTAVTSSSNHQFVRGLGADHVIDYRREDFASSGRIYDVVIDCVGNAPFGRAVRCIKPGGTLVLVAVSSLKEMLFAGRNSRRSDITVIPINFEPSKADVEFVLDLQRAEGLTPVVDRTYTIDHIREAHERVDSGRKRGAIVLNLI